MRWWQRAILVALITLAAPFYATAMPVEPSGLEFASWPYYCRAKHQVMSLGGAPGSSGVVTVQEIDGARRSLGDRVFDHVHHYCWGLTHLARARLERDARQKQYLLREASAEIRYSLARIGADEPLYSDMALTLAAVEALRGDRQAAEELIDQARNATPENPRVYIALAILRREVGKLSESRAVLEQGIATVAFESPELHYNLGLICLELQDVECAQHQARVAYAHDYPFSGLADRLRKIGKWPEPQAAQ